MKKDWREKVGNFLSNEFVEVEVKPYKEGEKNDYFSVNKNGSFEENSDPANASAYQEETPAAGKQEPPPAAPPPCGSSGI